MFTKDIDASGKWIRAVRRENIERERENPVGASFQACCSSKSSFTFFLKIF